MQTRDAARIVAILLAGAAYVLGSHWLMIQTEASAWNVVGVLSPMLVVIGLGAWRSRHLGLALVCLAVLAALCVQAAMGVQVTAHALYLFQHAGINGFMALVFGSTLRPGRTALISAVAIRVHGGALIPEHMAYTRRLTQVWVIFFACIVAVSLLLYFFASFDSWAVFANLVTPVAVAGLFFGEHLIRYRLHPHFERSTIADAVRAYMHNSKSSGTRVPQ